MTNEEFDARIQKIFDADIGDDTIKVIDALWADIEAERGIVIDWREAMSYHQYAVVWFQTDNNATRDNDKRFATITRPAPKYRELSTSDKQRLLKQYIDVSLSDDELNDLCKAAGIETRVEMK